ncbi:hypothetical protein Tco_0230389, partial [Tanacetum coccineum]
MSYSSSDYRGENVVSPTQAQGDNLLEIPAHDSANRWCFTGAGADEAGSSLPPSLFVPTWGIHQRSRVTTPEECRDLMVNLITPGAHALRRFESLYDTHHALQESLETTRSHFVQTREDFNVVQNFYNTLSERHGKLREEHAQCSEGLAVVLAEKDSLMATNAGQA